MGAGDVSGCEQCHRCGMSVWQLEAKWLELLLSD
jgi:hypothetical protein